MSGAASEAGSIVGRRPHPCEAEPLQHVSRSLFLPATDPTGIGAPRTRGLTPGFAVTISLTTIRAARGSERKRTRQEG
jgi:hypothetical protein